MRIIKKTDAFAKVNLTLDVVGVKENGYHYLESIMQTVSLKDSVIAEYVSESPFDIAFDVFPDSGNGGTRRRKQRLRRGYKVAFLNFQNRRTKRRKGCICRRVSRQRRSVLS